MRSDLQPFVQELGRRWFMYIANVQVEETTAAKGTEIGIRLVTNFQGDGGGVGERGGGGGGMGWRVAQDSFCFGLQTHKLALKKTCAHWPFNEGSTRPSRQADTNLSSGFFCGRNLIYGAAQATGGFL